MACHAHDFRGTVASVGAGGASQTSAANPGAPARWYGLSPDEGAAVVPPLIVGVLVLIPLEQSTL